MVPVSAPVEPHVVRSAGRVSLDPPDVGQAELAGCDEFLQSLQRQLRATVPGLTGFTVTVMMGGLPLRLSWIDPHLQTAPVRVSLIFPLAVFVALGEPESVIELYASSRAAFVEIARTLGLSRQECVLNENPSPPVAGTAITGLSDIDSQNQAIGRLVGQGYPVEDACTEVRRRQSASAQSGGRLSSTQVGVWA